MKIYAEKCLTREVLQHRAAIKKGRQILTKKNIQHSLKNVVTSDNGFEYVKATATATGAVGKGKIHIENG